MEDFLRLVEFYFCELCTNSAHFSSKFSTLKLSLALLFDSISHTSICAWFYLVCSFVLWHF